MFQLAYILRELRRRRGRTILTALGLAVGVGFVISIIGVSQGLDEAQNQVLAPLQSVGTDILVTRVAGAQPTSSSSPSSPTSSSVPAPSQGRGGQFFGNRGPGNALNQADSAALLNENSNVVTDLAKLGKPGDPFTRDFFLSATLLSFPQDAVAQVAKLPGVTRATPGLVQLAEHQTGTVPQIVASIQTGGQKFTQTVRPDPMTDSEREAFRQCLQSKGLAGGGSNGNGDGGPRRGQNNPALDECMPQRFREFQAQFTLPLQTIRQVVNPPSTNIKSQTYTAAGIEPANSAAGLVTADQLTEGRWLAKDASDEVLVNVAYANTKSLHVGSTIPVNGTTFKVVGLVRPTLTGSTADIYFPLSTLQRLAGKDGRVTQVMVKAAKSSSVEAVATQIKQLLPGAEVVTTKGLADQVTGSLADAHQLASRLGGIVAIILLLGAFAIAALLTLSSIAKRVREIGTLRAIGWSKARVLQQLLGETVGIGLLGGVAGVALGTGLAKAANALTPSLSATSSGVPGLAGSSLSRLFGQATTAAQTTQVTLRAPLHPATLGLGVLFALIGGVLAGLLGGWRAARLAPAVALRDLG